MDDEESREPPGAMDEKGHRYAAEAGADPHGRRNRMYPGADIQGDRVAGAEDGNPVCAQGIARQGGAAMLALLSRHQPG